jgi:NTE family protein
MAFQPTLRRLAALLTVLAAIAEPPSAAAADRQDAPAPPRPRPRVGLALGGGSARGLAHVGVLEWLREHRVPVDAVAGTSIGGLIGGIYAIGMTEREIRTLTEQMDWDVVLASDAPFEDKTFRRKQDRRAFPASLQFGVRRGLYLPRSLNAGQRIALMLDRLTLKYSALPSFDDLPTPFRCLAFDINRAESVVLGHGVLAEAMRATMALPGIFPPVTIDDRLLVDGGFGNNVPADVARQMGVDVVIAVDVGRSPAARPDISAWSMIGRAIDAVMASATRRSLQSADVVITPDVSDLASIDWNKAAVLRDRGYRAAAASAEALLHYAVTEAEYEAHDTARLARRRAGPVVPSMLAVTGLERGDRESLTRQIRTRPGRPLDEDQLATDLLLLSGTDRYELLTYHLLTVPGGTQLVITATTRPNGPAFLTLGAELNNIDASNFAANLTGRTTIYDAVGRGSEVRLDFVVGTRQGAGVEWFRPFLAPWLFAAPRASVSHGARNLFLEDTQVGEYGLTRGGVGFDVGLLGGRDAELRVGAELVGTDATVRVGGPLLPEVSGWDRSVSAQFTYDGQDSPVVPSRGTHLRARVRRFFSVSDAVGTREVVAAIENPERFTQAEADAISVFSFTEKNRLLTRIAAGTSFDDHPYFNDFSLGGPFRMSAFRNDELRGAHYGLALAGYLRQLPRPPAWVGGHAYLAAWVEVGSAFASRDTATWRTDVSAGLIVDSLIGPIFAGGSAGRDGHHRLYVALGPLFR